MKHFSSSLKCSAQNVSFHPSLVHIAWMIYYRKSFVVRASQPEFLSLVAFGCLMVASALIPLSIEGGYAFERDPITLDETGLPNDDIKVSMKTSLEVHTFHYCLAFSN